MRFDSGGEKEIEKEKRKERSQDADAQNKKKKSDSETERGRTSRWYNGSKDRGLITHKSQSNYAHASAGQREDLYVISLFSSSLFSLSPCLARERIAITSNHRFSSVNFAFNYAKVRSRVVSHFFGYRFKALDLVLAANFLMSRG